MRLIFLLFSFSVCMQAKAQPLELQGLDYNQIASYYIQYLKAGSLFVRLQTKSKKIAILKKAGHLSAAKKVQEDQLRINSSIVAAFRGSFKFCPVYFFYTDDSKHILKSNIDSVQFLDDKLNYNSQIRPTGQFLIGEFGIIKEDTAKYYNGSAADYEKDSTGTLYKNKQYSGTANMSFGALIIKSPQLVQLPRPFPYYMRTLSTIPIVRRSHTKVVRRMDYALNMFYNRTMGLQTFPE
ncbi:MAG: hypothetical protein AB8B72_12870 [Crocinitomicaceae bacterium]